jgi:hypothetical protein
MCHFTIRETDANKYLCHTTALPNYSWVYKGRIPSKKVKLAFQILFKLYQSKFDSVNTSSNMFHVSIEY